MKNDEFTDGIGRGEIFFIDKDSYSSYSYLIGETGTSVFEINLFHGD